MKARYRAIGAIGVVCLLSIGSVGAFATRVRAGRGLVSWASPFTAQQPVGVARPLHVTARLDRDLILALTQVRLAPTVSGAFWARHAPGTAGVYVLVYATVRNTGDADRYVYADRTLCVIDATGHALPYDPDATSEAGWHYQSANYSLIKAGNASDEILAFDGTRPAHTVQIGYHASGGQVHRLAAVSL